MSKRRLDALIDVASRGIDEIEFDLDNCADDERAEKRREIETACEGLDYLIAWRKSMDLPKQKKPRLSKEEMVAIALNQIEDRLTSPGIREIAEG